MTLMLIPHNKLYHRLSIGTGMAYVALIASPLCAQFRNASEELGYSGDGKAAFADFDGDGLTDVYAGGKLFRNERGARFVVAEEAGVPGGEGIWGDADNDGRPDLFIFTGTGSLYLNRGDREFHRVEFPNLPTVNSRGAVWFDLQNDARLDLYVGGYEIWQQTVHPDAVFVNQGDAGFSEQWRSPPQACYSARGVSAADFDEDGLVDVYVSNYRLQPNFLWKFDEQRGPANAATEAGAAGISTGMIHYTGGIQYGIHGHTIGSAVGDLDDDGHTDIFVANFSHPPAIQNRPQFLRNLGPAGDYKFQDRSAAAGLAWQESFASAALGDYDNDGDLDLYFTTVYATGSGGIKNYPVLYRNDGNWRFTDVTESEGLSKLGPTYQAAWADIDNDGDLDLCTAGKLFLNEGRRGHWIEVLLVGDGRTVNRSGVGATARLHLGDRIVTRHVETGTGEGNQNDLRLHFGLGEHDAPVTLDIAWPGGHRQTVAKLAPNRMHRIEFKH